MSEHARVFSVKSEKCLANLYGVINDFRLKFPIPDRLLVGQLYLRVCASKGSESERSDHGRTSRSSHWWCGAVVQNSQRKADGLSTRLPLRTDRRLIDLVRQRPVEEISPSRRPPRACAHLSAVACHRNSRQNWQNG